MEEDLSTEEEEQELQMRCVIVLEEVRSGRRDCACPAGSVHNPWMGLHGLIDRGVYPDLDLDLDLEEQDGFVRLPIILIIGISNWSLDASKRNRMRTTQRGRGRGSPSTQHLVLTSPPTPSCRAT